MLGLCPLAAYAGWIGAHLETGSTSNTVADGDYSGAIGYGNNMTGAKYSLSVGSNNVVTEVGGSSIGYDNMAVGYNNTVDGDRSVAVGYSNQVLEDYSAAIGKGLIISNRSGVVVGSYNDTSEYTSDISFAVGTGASSGSANNAIIVFQNGETHIKKVKQMGGLPMGDFTAD